MQGTGGLMPRLAPEAIEPDQEPFYFTDLSYIPARGLSTARHLLSRYIQRGVPGVDRAIATACLELGVPAEPRLVNWHQTGLPTIGTKNRELIKAAPDLCVAIRQSFGASTRTRNCASRPFRRG
jgi:hypothetical protein